MAKEPTRLTVRVATGQPLVPFAYERALRVVHDGFTGRIDEEQVAARLEGALGGVRGDADTAGPGDRPGPADGARELGHAWNNHAVPDI